MVFPVIEEDKTWTSCSTRFLGCLWSTNYYSEQKLVHCLINSHYCLILCFWTENGSTNLSNKNENGQWLFYEMTSAVFNYLNDLEDICTLIVLLIKFNFGQILTVCLICHFPGMRRDVNTLIFLDVRKALEGKFEEHIVKL